MAWVHGRQLPRLVAVLLVTGVLLASGAIALVGYAAADRFVHPPRDLDARTPAVIGLPYENVSFVTNDGLRLAGWWIPAANGTASTVVFLHGYAASKAQSLEVVPFLHRAGYQVLAFDFRAHGQSQGTYTTVGVDEVGDVRAALDWLASRGDVDATRVALFGWSMGAATAINAAAHGLPVRALVLDSPFASLDAVAARMLTRSTGLPPYPFAAATFAWAEWMTHRAITDDEPVRSAPRVGTPVLVIQGQFDSVLADDGRSVGDAAGKNATFWLVPGAGHLAALREAPVEYQEKVLGFLGKAFVGVCARCSR